MTYVEHLVASPLISCTWEQLIDAPHEQRIVPDACVDLIWSGRRLSVAGPDTRARVATLVPGTRIVGVRLRPGVAGAVLGRPAGEVCDEAPDARDVLGRDATEALQAGPHARRTRARGGLRRSGPHDRRGHATGRTLACPISQRPHADRSLGCASMPVDHAAAETFIWSTARLLDRHRYAMLFKDGPAEPVIAALRA